VPREGEFAASGVHVKNHDVVGSQTDSDDISAARENRQLVFEEDGSRTCVPFFRKALDYPNLRRELSFVALAKPR
jgi:hypothetical protein